MEENKVLCPKCNKSFLIVKRMNNDIIIDGEFNEVTKLEIKCSGDCDFVFFSEEKTPIAPSKKEIMRPKPTARVIEMMQEIGR